MGVEFFPCEHCQTILNDSGEDYYHVQILPSLSGITLCSECYRDVQTDYVPSQLPDNRNRIYLTNSTTMQTWYDTPTEFLRAVRSGELVAKDWTSFKIVRHNVDWKMFEKMHKRPLTKISEAELELKGFSKGERLTLKFRDVSSSPQLLPNDDTLLSVLKNKLKEKKGQEFQLFETPSPLMKYSEAWKVWEDPNIQNIRTWKQLVRLVQQPTRDFLTSEDLEDVVWRERKKSLPKRLKQTIEERKELERSLKRARTMEVELEKRIALGECSEDEPDEEELEEFPKPQKLFKLQKKNSGEKEFPPPPQGD